ncbi:uncharacterized protein LOC111342376 [Stylophora pistillata]|uniref:uncharacterized protein LOC111342376 n=1 Tax=Stylophora pistillata TaxID=50429 RepID=UPI000C046726|nr:uncharacterized protein LOC111342376 [Stylophora pistillata]
MVFRWNREEDQSSPKECKEESIEIDGHLAANERGDETFHHAPPYGEETLLQGITDSPTPIWSAVDDWSQRLEILPYCEGLDCCDRVSIVKSDPAWRSGATTLQGLWPEMEKNIWNSPEVNVNRYQR